MQLVRIPRKIKCILLSIKLIPFFLFTFTYKLFAGTLGYDENTEVVISGFVEKINIEPSDNPSDNWFYFGFISNNKRYIVVTAPNWYVKKIKFNPQEGHHLHIVGSKFKIHDRYTFLIARSIKNQVDGKFYLFRDKNGRAIWEISGVTESSCIEKK